MGNFAYRVALATLAFGAVLSAAQAQSFNVVYAFKGGSDGAAPFGGVVSDANKNLYGVTRGGARSCGEVYCGTVFRIAADGTNTILYQFKGGKDGYEPFSALTLDSAGNLYGTTLSGGANSCGENGPGCGTVFKLTPDGKETVLHSFGGSNDGVQPSSGLIADKDGTLYGETAFGGFNFGTVYKIAPDGGETILYAFKGGADGAQPIGGLIFDKKGNLYGTTAIGGQGCKDVGCGIVFQLAPNGRKKTLYAFLNVRDGKTPLSGVVLAKNGALYGSTYTGRTGKCFCGTIFNIPSGSQKTTIHGFQGSPDDGRAPDALTISDGEIFGVTREGGDGCSDRRGCGTVFEMTTGGAEQILYSFQGKTDGQYPTGPVLKLGKSFYGTAFYGGQFNAGVVFKVTP